MTPGRRRPARGGILTRPREDARDEQLRVRLLREHPLTGLGAIRRARVWWLWTSGPDGGAAVEQCARALGPVTARDHGLLVNPHSEAHLVLTDSTSLESDRSVSDRARARDAGRRPSGRKERMTDRDVRSGDRLREECGVFGIWGAENAARLDVRGALRAAAPRAGERGHRRDRRDRVPRAPGRRPRLGRLRRERPRHLRGHDRDRPQPLLHHRRQPAPERAAARRELPRGNARDRAQREPRQRARASRRARGAGFHLPDDERHRGASST